MIDQVACRLACENSLFMTCLHRVCTFASYVAAGYLVVPPKVVAKDLSTCVAGSSCYKRKIGLVRLCRHSVGEDAREILRRFRGADEPSYIFALRELDEETGLTCLQKCLLNVVVVLSEAGIFRGCVDLFVALKCHKKHELPSEQLGHCDFRGSMGEEISGLLRNSGFDGESIIPVQCKLFQQQPSLVSW